MSNVYTITLVNSEDWPTPDFGPAGPDLLAWDDAVDNWEPEKRVLAVVYEDEVAANTLLKHFETLYKDKGEDYEVEMDVHDPEKVSPPEGISLKDFWNEHVGWVFEDNPNYQGFKVCNEGKPIVWEEDLTERVPVHEDFIAVMINVVEGDIENAVDSVDYPRDKKRLMLTETIEEWWVLHDKLYGDKW